MPRYESLFKDSGFNPKDVEGNDLYRRVAAAAAGEEAKDAQSEQANTKEKQLRQELDRAMTQYRTKQLRGYQKRTQTVYEMEVATRAAIEYFRERYKSDEITMETIASIGK